MDKQVRSSQVEQAEQVEQAVGFLQPRLPSVPGVGIILGSGLGKLAHHVADAVSVDYEQIPHFPRSTAIGHRGRLLFGHFGGAAVAVMDGRLHGYEGYSWQDLTRPVRVLHRLGARVLVVSNASGGLNPGFQAGDVMIIDDHINLLRGAGLASLPPSVDDRGSPAVADIYDSVLADWAVDAARQHGFAARRGVYVALSGPNYETRSEYRMLRRLGGDAVGMSTVPEATEARRLGMRVLALSTITNVARPDAPQVVHAEDVVHTAESAAERVRCMMEEVIGQLETSTP